MNLKNYFYYRQQYQRLNKSGESETYSQKGDNNEASIEEDNNNETLEQAKGAVRNTGDSISGLGQENNPKPKSTFLHSRFQELAPGVFQFKHIRPKMIQHPSTPISNRYAPEFLTRNIQPAADKPGTEEFVKIGTFPGASDQGLPVYQFT